MPHPEPEDQPRSSPISGPTTPTLFSPVRLKKTSSVGAVCGNDSSFTNKADYSVTDGINSEHKQEQRQSAKDTGSARRYRQPISRRVRNNAGQHGRIGGTPPHQSTSDRRVRTTHQTDATTTEARQTQEAHDIPPHEGQHNLGTPRGVEIEAESSRAKGYGPHLAPGEEGNEATSGGMSGTKNCATLSKGRESNHGRRGSRAYSKSLAV